MKSLLRQTLKQRIPNMRLLGYLLLAGIVPILLAVMVVASQRAHLRQLKEEMQQIKIGALVAYRKARPNQRAREQFGESDHFFIDRQLETLRLLEDEWTALTSLIEQEPSLPDREVLSRLEFLKGRENRLVFSEGMVGVYGDVQETQESLVHPVEVDVADLKALLERIEGDAWQEGRPQLIISDFDLKRKRLKSGNEVFLLDLKVIKREYTCDSTDS